MSGLSRRGFLALGAASALGLGACSRQRYSVVVVGGGFGGATTARYLRLMAPNISVTLIEPQTVYYTCPFSNTVLAGMRSLESLQCTYKTLVSEYGVTLVQKRVSQIDAPAKTLIFEDGGRLAYDRVVISPGIDFHWDAIEGYDAPAAQRMPHAWRGGDQIALLRNRLLAMPDGGTVVIAPPAYPYRCPTGPYERASLIAYYLKQHKPRSKVLILDAKDDFTKRDLFIEGWRSLYPNMIEWVPLSQGGLVVRVEPSLGRVHTNFSSHKADVANIIPPQKAARLAFDSDLVDSTGWCPVDALSFESTRHAGVHVIGDSCQGGDMPKSAFSANAQAKVCAAAMVDLLDGREAGEPSWLNICYSLLAPDYGISVAAAYHRQGGEIRAIADAGGASPTPGDRAAQARYARGWYANIRADSWG